MRSQFFNMTSPSMPSITSPVTWNERNLFCNLSGIHVHEVRLCTSIIMKTAWGLVGWEIFQKLLRKQPLRSIMITSYINVRERFLLHRISLSEWSSEKMSWCFILCTYVWCDIVWQCMGWNGEMGAWYDAMCWSWHRITLCHVTSGYLKLLARFTERKLVSDFCQTHRFRQCRISQSGRGQCLSFCAGDLTDKQSSLRSWRRQEVSRELSEWLPSDSPYSLDFFDVSVKDRLL